MAKIQAHFSNPVVLSEVAMIQIGSTQSANTRMPHKMANPKDTRGRRANNPTMTRKMTSRFESIFIKVSAVAAMVIFSMCT